MGFTCGIVGLPNIGKTTLYNALTHSHAPAENYPFCTTTKNHGVVAVPDERLLSVAAICQQEQVTGTTLEFVDIAGLVKGASQGEGLGNKFLGDIQEVDALAHVVRCFADPNIVHSYGSVDPRRDAEIVETELLIRDLDMVQKRIDKQSKVARAGDKAAREEMQVLQLAEKALGTGKAARALGLTPAQRERLLPTPLLTLKPTFFVANIADSQIGAPSDPALQALRALAKDRGAPLVEISMMTEAELDDLDEADRAAYMKELGLTERGLSQIIRAGYRLLDLVTFFTVVGVEARAWTVPAGTTAVRAAGKIHTDMERGFIKAEVLRSADLIRLGSEQALRAHGLFKLEGKEYIVCDGDVIRFRFSA